MAKIKSSSWLPKGKVQRTAASGRFVTSKHAASLPATTSREAVGKLDVKTYASKSGKASGLLRKIRLPNGDIITTVRGDVMDRALGRGEFKKA